MEGGDPFWSGTHWRIFGGRRTEETEKSNCNQGYPGMLLVTLRILIHTRFVCVFDSWIFNCCVDFCVDEKGHNLFCWDWLLACLPCFGFGCHWCLRKHITPCLNVIIFCSSFKSYSAFVPLFLAHGLIFEVGAIHVYWSTPSAISFSKFYFNFFYLLSIFFSSHGVRTSALVFGLHWNMTEESI